MITGGVVPTARNMPLEMPRTKAVLDASHQLIPAGLGLAYGGTEPAILGTISASGLTKAIIDKLLTDAPKAYKRDSPHNQAVLRGLLLNAPATLNREPQPYERYPNYLVQ
jgi:hypothetical protein